MGYSALREQLAQAFRQGQSTAGQLDGEGFADLAGIETAVAGALGCRRVFARADWRDPGSGPAEHRGEAHDLAGEIVPGGAVRPGDVEDTAEPRVVGGVQHALG